MVIKRLIDILLSYVAIFALWPIFLAIALCIKLNSRGKAIFSQKRVGKKQREFVLYKFRTMVNNAESLLSQYLHINEADGPVFKIRNDPRLTRIGRFLRDTNLDELPQLWNVLKGDMSLIGPRPALPEEVKKYKDWHKERFRIKPGMASLIHAQDEYFVSINFDNWIKSDIQYIKTLSFKSDMLILLKIILKTTRNLFINIFNVNLR